MNAEQVSTLLVRMRGAWPKLVIDDDVEQAWLWALEDTSLDAVAPAVKELMQTQKFPPTPAEILEVVAETATALPTPSAAWGMVLDRIKTTARIGDPSPWLVPDEIKQAVLDAGGLYAIRTSELPAANQKRFLEGYTARRAETVRTVQTTGALPAGRVSPPIVAVEPGVYASDPEAWHRAAERDRENESPAQLSTGTGED